MVKKTIARLSKLKQSFDSLISRSVVDIITPSQSIVCEETTANPRAVRACIKRLETLKPMLKAAIQAKSCPTKLSPNTAYDGYRLKTCLKTAFQLKAKLTKQQHKIAESKPYSQAWLNYHNQALVLMQQVKMLINDISDELLSA